MNSIGKTMLSGLLLLSLECHAHLKNTSFEEADTPPTKATHWGVWGDKLERVTGWSPTEDGEAMIAYKHWELPENHEASSGIFQDAQDIEAGETYEFTVSGFSDNPEWGEIKGRIEIRLEATVDGKQVFLDRKVVEFEKFLGKWGALSVTAKTPVDNLRAVIEFYPADSAKGGAMKVDSVTLKKVQQSYSYLRLG